jgi:hypothetical protein
MYIYRAFLDSKDHETTNENEDDLNSIISVVSPQQQRQQRIQYAMTSMLWPCLDLRMAAAASFYHGVLVPDTLFAITSVLKEVRKRHYLYIYIYIYIMDTLSLYESIELSTRGFSDGSPCTGLLVSTLMIFWK